MTVHSTRARWPASIMTLCVSSLSKMIPLASSVAWTVCGALVLLLITEARTARSPTTKKRDTTGRTSKGRVLTTLSSASPTCVFWVMPRASTAQVVRLSGSVNEIVASPLTSVTIWGAHSGVCWKSSRTSTLDVSAPLAAPSSIIASLSAISNAPAAAGAIALTIPSAAISASSALRILACSRISSVMMSIKADIAISV